MTVPNEIESDHPCCPKCGYLLIGLTSRICPECGTHLAADLAAYKPSQQPAPWSPRNPTHLWLGFAQVLRHPGRTFSLCHDPQQVATRRTIWFALFCSLSLVLAWPALRELGMYVVMISNWKWPKFVQWVFGEFGLRQFAKPSFWTRIWGWECWSIVRWWILFGLLAFAPMTRAKRGVSQTNRSLIAERLRRLCLFAPWLIILELALLIGVWVDHSMVVPEPSTIFVGEWWDWNCWLYRDWLIRAVLPTFVVGLVFFRHVLCLRWSLTIMMAIVLVPIAINWSILWSMLYLELFLK